MINEIDKVLYFFHSSWKYYYFIIIIYYTQNVKNFLHLYEYSYQIRKI